MLVSQIASHLVFCITVETTTQAPTGNFLSHSFIENIIDTFETLQLYNESIQWRENHVHDEHANNQVTKHLVNIK